MSDPTNLAKDAAGARSREGAADAPDSDTVRRTRRVPPKLDFDTPDEESMQFIEDQWRKFCRSVGLEGDIPDIRAIAAARKTRLPRGGRQSHWLVRPFFAVHRWFKTYP
jgi:hypothetical protein